ncbi:MAG: TolC family protein, partial [Gemmataceae bacterium]|nr:TolC family protein [Gemmataceae bacterium]
DTDRTAAEVGATFELPLPLRNARGLTATARAQLAQLLAQERFARDDIAAQVKDAVSELHLTYQRLGQARIELREAQRALDLQLVGFKADLFNLFTLNAQEIAAAQARVKVVAVLGAYFGAVANYRAVLGLDGPGAQGGRVLPALDPLLPDPPKMVPPAKP